MNVCIDNPKRSEAWVASLHSPCGKAGHLYSPNMHVKLGFFCPNMHHLTLPYLKANLPIFGSFTQQVRKNPLQSFPFTVTLCFHHLKFYASPFLFTGETICYNWNLHWEDCACSEHSESLYHKLELQFNSIQKLLWQNCMKQAFSKHGENISK